MNCSSDRIQDYVLGALAEDEARDLELHAKSCSRCARELEQYGALFIAIRDLPLPPVPVGIPEAVLTRLSPELAAAALSPELARAIPDPELAAARLSSEPVAAQLRPEPAILQPALDQRSVRTVTRSFVSLLSRPAVRIVARVVRTPDFAAGAGIAIGLILAFFPPPILRIAAGLAGGTFADLATGFSVAVTAVVRDLLTITGILEHLTPILVVLRALVRIPGDALRMIPGQVSLLSVALTLLMALCMGWLVGQVRREKLSYAKQ